MQVRFLFLVPHIEDVVKVNQLSFSFSVDHDVDGVTYADWYDVNQCQGSLSCILAKGNLAENGNNPREAAMNLAEALEEQAARLRKFAAEHLPETLPFTFED